VDADCARNRRARQYVVSRTAEQVAEAILKYYRLGVDSFLIRGFDPLTDAIEFGRELIPRIKARAIEIDSVKAAE